MTRPQLIIGTALLGLLAIGIAIVVLIATTGNQTSALESSSAAAVAPADEVLALESLVGEVADQTEFVGRFAGDGPFSVVGEATVSADESGERTLRLSEDFRTNRGQELVVYLRAQNGDFVNLGVLQSPSGEQVYDVPGLVDLTVFDEVEIYDVQSSVVFGSASISPQ